MLFVQQAYLSLRSRWGGPFDASLGAYLTALLIGCGASLLLQAPFVGFSSADEPSHFLNAFFIKHYLSNNFGAHPIEVAQSFYLHYPKLAIGHWPPLYYGVVGLLFYLVPATPTGAMVVNTLIAAIPAVFVSFWVRRMGGTSLAAVVGAALYAALPLVLQSQVFFLADQAVTILLCGAAVAWSRYAERPTAARSVVFAALASAAVLTKGNGWLVGLVPPFFMLLNREWAPLKDWRTYLGAALFVVCVLPWYALTLRISADGFLFQPGLAYAATALRANTAALLQNLGVVGMGLLALGVLSGWAARRQQPGHWRWACCAASLALSVLVFQCIAPAALETRYMAPALPPAAALIVIGMNALLCRADGHRTARRALVSWGVFLLWMITPGAYFLYNEQPKVDLRMREAIEISAPVGLEQALLIDGQPGAEGAFIAAAAAADPEQRLYIVRASQLLADSDWNATRYLAKYESPEQIDEVLRSHGIGQIVIVRRELEPVPVHSQLLQRSLEGSTDYKLAAILPHRHRAGVTNIYRATKPIVPSRPAIEATNFPRKAASLGASKSN